MAKTNTSTKISYLFKGKTKNGSTYTLEVEEWEQDKIAKILKDKKFMYHVPEMWAEKCAVRDPGYDVKCEVISITKLTTTTTREWEDIPLA